MKIYLNVDTNIVLVSSKGSLIESSTLVNVKQDTLIFKRGSQPSIEVYPVTNDKKTISLNSKLIFGIKPKGQFDTDYILIAAADPSLDEKGVMRWLIIPTFNSEELDLALGVDVDLKNDKTEIVVSGELSWVNKDKDCSDYSAIFPLTIQNNIIRDPDAPITQPLPGYPPADTLVSRADVGKANGVASLDAQRRVPQANLPMIPSDKITVNNTLTSYATNIPLSAYQGRNLNDKILALEAGGGGGGGSWDGGEVLNQVTFWSGFSCYGGAHFSSGDTSFNGAAYFNTESFSMMCAVFNGAIRTEGDVEFKGYGGGSFHCDMPAFMNTLRVGSGINFSGSGRDVALGVSSDNKLTFDGVEVGGGGGGSWDGGTVTKETVFKGNISLYSNVYIGPYSGSASKLGVYCSPNFYNGATFSGGATTFNSPATFRDQVSAYNYPIQSQYGYSFNSEVGIYYSQSGGGVTIKGASFSAPVGISCGGLSVSYTTTLWSILEFGGTAYSYLNSLEGCGLSWDNTTKKLNLHYYSNGVQQTEALNP